MLLRWIFYGFNRFAVFETQQDGATGDSVSCCFIGN